MSSKPDNSSNDKKQPDTQHKPKESAPNPSTSQSWRTQSVAVFDSIDIIRGQVTDSLKNRGRK